MTTFKHTPEEARELVAKALESGDYTQGNGFLCREDRYCCLGIACEMFIKHEAGGLTKTGGLTKRGDSYLKEVQQYGLEGDPVFSSAFLPSNVMAWLDFKYRDGTWDKSMKVAGTRSTSSMAATNDAGVSFANIAVLFRNPPKGLLT